MTEQLHFNGFDKVPDDIPQTDLAWAAGLIDGEGCISISRQAEKRHGTIQHRMQLIVRMTSEKTINHIRDIFGVGATGTQVRIAPRKTIYYWITSSNQSANILKLIRPYLITKASEADIAIEFQCSEKVFYMQGGTPQRVIEHRDELMRRIKQYKPFGKGRKKAAKLHSS